MNRIIYIVSFMLLCVACGKEKTFEEYRSESQALDSELCALDNDRLCYEGLLEMEDSIRKDNPYFNLDSVRTLLKETDSIIDVKSKQLNALDKECRNIYGESPI